MGELADEVNESHVQHGVRANASITHQSMPGRTPYDGHDPEALVQSYLDQGYVEVDLDGRYLADVKVVGFRLFVRTQD